ncbi:MAG: CoA-binding protein [Candidatus Omnitrophica bacterium]|nr:CoA-binding protein [Candidatus Omnitrophota bacterium]
MQDIKKKTIVVVGVSHKEDKFGFRIFNDLLKNGFNVLGVNPTDGEIAASKIYRSLKEITTAIDLVITVVPASVTERVVDECKELGIKEIWMQPGSESDSAIEKAKKYGISVVSNACFMVEQGIW